MHNLSLTALLKLSEGEELPGEAPEEYDSWKLSGSHGLEKAYVQPIGLIRNIYHSFKSK